MPIVTVGIPTMGDRAGYLEQAIRSVLDQTLSEIEVFVSDNGPTGASAALVATFNDPRLNFVKLPKPGLHANLNNCLRLGSAPLLAICQDDDVWLPWNLEKLVKAIERGPAIAFAHAAFDMIDSESRALRRKTFWGPWEGDPVESGQEFIRRSMSTGTRVNMSSALIRREVVAGNRFRETDGPACDVGFWLRLAHGADVAFVAESLTCLRVHPGATSIVEGINDEHRRPVMKEIQLAQDVKHRFLTELEPDPRRRQALGKLARTWANQELLNIVVRQTSPGRSIVATLGALSRSVRIEPSLLRAPRTYRILLATLVGRTGRRLVRRLMGLPHDPRSRPEPTMSDE